MKLFIMVVFAVSALAGTARAEDSPQSKFYEFPAFTVEGTNRAPTITFTDPRAKVRFDRLMSLQKGFLDPYDGVTGTAGRESVLK